MGVIYGREVVVDAVIASRGLCVGGVGTEFTVK